ncbi:MAG: BamA/OMP85 family outer membrane protein [Janthinobacterium lividum]
MSASFGLAPLLPVSAQVNGATPGTAPVSPVTPASPAAPPADNPAPETGQQIPANPGQTINPPAPAGNAPATPAPAFTVPPVDGADTTDTAGNAPQLTGRISRILIAGNRNINDAAIRGVITSAGLRLGDTYTAANAIAARDAVKNMGYFNGDIGLTGAQDPAGGVDITFTVRENPVIKTIKFTANTPNGEPTISAVTLKSLMTTKEGQVLNTNILVRDLDNLFNHTTSYVYQQGFIFDVSSDINIDPLTGVLTIPLVEAHINSIKITGLKKTKPIVVTRELRSQVGDVLDEKKLQKDLTRVYNLGLFDEVGPFDPSSTDVGKVDITVPVTEKRSGQVSVGVGYSSTAKLVGQAQLAENNFRGLGERVSLQWQVGGVDSQSSLELGFFEPYLDKRHTSLDLDLYDKAVYRFDSGSLTGGSVDTTGNTNTYVERHRGATFGINRPYGDALTLGITGRSESVTTDNFTVSTADQYIRQKGTVTGVGLRGILSNRDNESAPAAGGLTSLSVEFVGASTEPADSLAVSPLPPGREYFTKLGVDIRRYSSLQGPRKPGNFNQPKRVLATRLLIGTTARDVPFFEQYFLGGADSLRGYDQDRFWGSSLALFQAELRVPVGKDNNFQGVLLFDGGDAWNSIYQVQGLTQHTAFKLEADYGVGIRLVTPIGPIRLDYAIPTTGGGSGRTQFSIGQSF